MPGVSRSDAETNSGGVVKATSCPPATSTLLTRNRPFPFASLDETVVRVRRPNYEEIGTGSPKRRRNSG